MIFTETNLAGVFAIELECKSDERGFFARAWCPGEFQTRGLNTKIAQCNVSFNRRKGTLRGLHYQKAPHAETKLVRCTRGSLFDVVIDLRPESPTFKQHVGIALTAEKRNMVYIPEGCAHGFLTLEDATEIFYQISEFHHPESAGGVRFNDPAFQISWPGNIEVISERDRTYTDFSQ